MCKWRKRIQKLNQKVSSSVREFPKRSDSWHAERFGVAISFVRNCRKWSAPPAQNAPFGYIKKKERRPRRQRIWKEVDRVVRMYKAGASQAEIARRYSASARTVHLVLEEGGVSEFRDTGDAHRGKRLDAEHRKKMSVSQKARRKREKAGTRTAKQLKFEL